jgi:hypothetical protein
MDPWTLQHIAALKNELEGQRQPKKITQGSTARTVRELEEDVLFLSLMNRALLEILIKQGLCTKAQLVTEMKRLDILDGQEDGGLDTDTLAQDLGVSKPDKR